MSYRQSLSFQRQRQGARRFLWMLIVLMLSGKHRTALAWTTCSPTTTIKRAAPGGGGVLFASPYCATTTSLFSSSSSDRSTTTTSSINTRNNDDKQAVSTAADSTSSSSGEFSEAELSLIVDLYNQIQQLSEDEVEEKMQELILETLPKLHPHLLLNLRNAGPTHGQVEVRVVAEKINDILNDRMELAKETLTKMLNAGEIRKLDALIGSAARSNQLDVAFFNVLTMNLQDAMNEQDQQKEEGSNKEEEEVEGGANRLQILRHIYTRCQEEVEKTIPPGTALLNKLLRTEQAAIRKNLYQHYLTPQPKTITTPDGKTVELKSDNDNNNNVLVPLDDFIQAIDTAVLQIRNVENAGGTDRESAAIMVESCRIVAKEARIVIGEHYGRESSQLLDLEDKLQEVFRPTSPDSKYIQGEAA